MEHVRFFLHYIVVRYSTVLYHLKKSILNIEYGCDMNSIPPNVETPASLMQGITKGCRPFWLTNSALIYEPKCGGCGVSAIEYNCAHGAQINFGDLTPYLFTPWFDVFRKPEYRQVVGSLGTTAMHTLLLLVNQIAQVGPLSGTKKLSGFNANLLVINGKIHYE